MPPVWFSRFVGSPHHRPCQRCNVTPPSPIHVSVPVTVLMLSYVSASLVALALPYMSRLLSWYIPADRICIGTPLLVHTADRVGIGTCHTSMATLLFLLPYHIYIGTPPPVLPCRRYIDTPPLGSMADRSSLPAVLPRGFQPRPSWSVEETQYGHISFTVVGNTSFGIIRWEHISWDHQLEKHSWDHQLGKH